ncbi:DUF4179 domain-containing protein [Paenibacillus tuaregi]|uniref:DUF4179 domain-containing protein n=1 Tax=Paenibacillus tuaregi TaxID=1816681 RepID=UPI000838C36F|nr:DUF4179 domain-containing protein [Paenibacillus tuaregi]
MTGGQQNLNQELGKLKKEEAEHLPEMIRQRMDYLYAHLNEVDQGSMRLGSENGQSQHMKLGELDQITTRPSLVKRGLRTLLISISAAAAAGVLIIGSGFVSPVMAEALRHIPLVGGIFSTSGDEGLKAASKQGLSTNVNLSLEHGGATLTISDLLYDGNRLSMVLTRHTADGNSLSLSDWLGNKNWKKGEGINQIEFTVNGERVNTSMGTSKAQNDEFNSIIINTMDAVLLKDSTTEVQQIPEQFDLGVRIYDAKQDYWYSFKIPVKKAGQNNILIQPTETKSLGNNTFKILKLEMTPATVRLDAQMEGKSGEDIKEIAKKLPDKYKIDGFINIKYDLADDNGTLLKPLGATGNGRGDMYWFTGTYEPQTKRPKSITVKPFTERNGKKVYIPELEYVLPVPSK